MSKLESKLEQNKSIPFMDEVHAITFNKKMGPLSLNDPAITALRKMRIALRKAEKFVLDDDAVKLVVELSGDKEKFSSWSFLARLPFDYTWIEYNQHTKVKELRDVGRVKVTDKDFLDISPIKGLLLFKDNDETRWVCQSFQKISNGHIVPDIFIYVFDPEGTALNPIRGSKFWNKPTLSLMPNFPKIEMVEYSGTNKEKIHLTDAEFPLFGLFENDPDGNVVPPSWFASRSAVIVNPFWSDYVNAKHRPEYAYENYMMEIRESQGHFRWLLTLLAMINELPKDVKPIKGRVHHHTSGMNKLHYFDHSVITMKIPKNRIVWAKEHLDHAGYRERRKQHDVIGHFRVIEKGKATHLCRHIPTMVESGLGMCERCGLLIRWIASHTRGDIRLGIVKHERKIQGKYTPIKKGTDDGNEEIRPKSC